MKAKIVGSALVLVLCVSCSGGSGGGSGVGGVQPVAMSVNPFNPATANGTGCDNELQQLAATPERYPVNVTTLGGGWGGKWDLICGLSDANQCPPPNSFECDFGTITLLKTQDNRMEFLGVGIVQNVNGIDSQWFWNLNSGSDNDLTRIATLENPGGAPVNLEISLFYDGQFGYMSMVRGDNNRRAVYRSNTQGPPSY